jgi:hypothetical protein
MKPLGRLVNFDERSRAFGVRHLLEAKKPRSYTWRCESYLDQGAEGACVGYACAHELAARPVEVPVDAALARSIYLDSQKIDPWPGGAYVGADPYYEGSSVLAGVKILRERGYVPQFRWAFGLQDLILSVGRLGPAVIGVNWYEGMFDTDRKHYVNVDGDIAGGHAIMVRGVNVKRRLFILHNSWGTGWGRYGQAFISWADMERLLHEDGEAVIPLRRAYK